MNDEQELNASARELLGRLKQEHLEARGANFMLSRGDRDLVEAFGGALRGTIDWLASKGLASWEADDGFTITKYGVEVAGNPDLLDVELPSPVQQAGAPKASTKNGMDEVYRLNSSARRLLIFLHAWHLRANGGPFRVGPSDQTFDACNLDHTTYKSAAGRLISKDLAKWAGTGGVMTITGRGVNAAEDESFLATELPLAPPSAIATDVPQDVAEGLGEIRSAALDIVHDEVLAGILERDIVELDAAVKAGLHKSAALLSGSITEALLMDAVDRRRDLAQAHMGKRKFPADASIDHLVEIAVAHNLLDSLGQSLVGGIKDYRDLIHPDRERRCRVKFDEATTGALIALLRLVIRCLNESRSNRQLEMYLNK